MKFRPHATHASGLSSLRLTFKCAPALLAVCLGLTTAAARSAQYELASPASGGGQGANGPSSAPQISADGRFIVFASQATNLTAPPAGGPPGPNAPRNIFIRDLQTDTTELVSVNLAGTAGGNGTSASPAVSADGRYVAFASTSSDLVANDTADARWDVFVRDTLTDTTTLVSLNAAGTARLAGDSFSPAMTPDGRSVAFLNDGPGSLVSNVFVRDRTAGTTTLVSVNSAGTGGGNNHSGAPGISADGRVVVFESSATDLTTLPDDNNTSDVFARDVAAGTTTLVSVKADGTRSGSWTSSLPSVSADGRVVAFHSFAADLVPPTQQAVWGIYARDLTAGVTTAVDRGLDVDFPLSFFRLAPGVSADGRYVAFGYNFIDDGAPAPHSKGNVARYDRLTGTLATLPDTGQCDGPAPARPCEQNTYRPSLSADGRRVTFGQRVAGQTPSEAAYFGDFLALTVTAIAAEPPAGGGELSELVTAPVISADGGAVAFSTRENLLPPDNNFGADIYRFQPAPAPQGPGGLIQLGMPSFRAEEGGGTLTVPVLRAAFGAAGPASVDFATADRTAQAGADYVAHSGTLTFGPGEEVKVITLQILNDGVYEGLESFLINLSNPTDGHALGGANRAAAVNIHDSIKPSFSISDATAREGAPAVFSVTVSPAPVQPLAVDFLTANGTASLGADYEGVSGTVVFGPGETTKTITVRTLFDLAAEPDETFSVLLVNRTADTTLARSQGVGTLQNDRTPVVEFAAGNVSVSEAAGAVAVIVRRVGGDPSVPFSVSYATSDETASERRDYIAALGRLDFAAGETAKTFEVLVNDDAFVEPPESVALTLSAPTNGAALGPGTSSLVITSDDPAPSAANPIDEARVFVAQHYRDFLNRAPDAAGLNFWTAEVNRLAARCDGVPAADARARCVLGARAQVSSAFFLSIEFQQTSYEVIRFYRASFGRAPTLREFLADTQEVSRGVVVGAPGWEAKLEANRQQFAAAWVARPEFRAAFDAASDSEYVSRLFLNGAGDASAEPALQAQLVGGLAGAGETRATALRKVADSGPVFNRQYNAAFVLMQYFGYLRRNPADPPDANLDGFNFWLDKLDQFSRAGEDVRDPGAALARVRRAQMVEAFIDSIEYRSRFGQ